MTRQGKIATMVGVLVCVVIGLLLGFGRINLLDGTDCGSAFKPRADEISTVDTYTEYGRQMAGKRPNAGYLDTAQACQDKTDGRRVPAILFLAGAGVTGLAGWYVAARRAEG